MNYEDMIKELGDQGDLTTKSISVGSDKRITNAEEIMKHINEAELNINTKEWLENLKRAVDNKTAIDENGELTELIDAKLGEIQAKDSEKVDIVETLTQAQLQNPDLKRLSIVETDRNINDSRKDLNYIKFVHEDGRVEMLAADSPEKVNEFLLANMNRGYSAEDTFNYFKEHVCSEVEFEEKDQFMENRKNGFTNVAIKDDPATLSDEQSQILEFQKSRELSSTIPEISVDKNGERIYNVSGNIIKFVDSEQSERRQMILISDIEKQKEMLDSANDDNNSTNPMGDTTDFENDINNQAEQEIINTDMSLEEETLLREQAVVMNLSDFENLLYKQNEMGIALSQDELDQVHGMVQYMINTMEDDRRNNEKGSDERTTLDGYMAGLQEKIDKGFELPPRDAQLYKDYTKELERVNNLQITYQKQKKLALQLDNNASHGVATIIILLEIAALGMFALMFLSLAVN